MDRLSTNYNSAKGLEYITPEDLLSVELNAALLDLDECYDMLFIENEHLSEKEDRLLKAAHRRGKKKSIANAANHLFKQMETKSGTAACIEFLRNCGKFSIEGTPGTNGAAGGFNFNVIMPGDENT